MQRSLAVPENRGPTVGVTWPAGRHRAWRALAAFAVAMAALLAWAVDGQRGR